CGKIQFIVLIELGIVADHTFSRNELESWLIKWRLEETS
ncbi:3-dehydroquinate synthase, partial [Bacillus spizizenii]|nr:3-dehydroquinate synthase [Bacillus spizizenii]